MLPRSAARRETLEPTGKRSSGLNAENSSGLSPTLEYFLLTFLLIGRPIIRPKERLLRLANCSMTCRDCGFWVCRKRYRKAYFPPRHIRDWRKAIERSTHNFQFRVLILHRGLYIAVPHRSHYGREVAGSHQNSRAIVVSRTVENQFFRKARFVARFSGEVAD